MKCSRIFTFSCTMQISIRRSNILVFPLLVVSGDPTYTTGGTPFPRHLIFVETTTLSFPTMRVSLLQGLRCGDTPEGVSDPVHGNRL